VVFRAWDASGVLRAVRAWRITDGDTPKRLPPAGCRHDGVVLANEAAWRVLRGARADEVVISEGETDWLSAATRWDVPVVGVISGSWTPELGDALARCERVIVRTDLDSAGDRYAADVIEGLRGRCELWRKAG
jgi:hypothetical protein